MSHSVQNYRIALVMELSKKLNVLRVKQSSL